MRNSWYRTITPAAQLQCVSSRNGWLAKEATVLSLASVLQEDELTRPRLDACQLAPITVLLGPRAFIGYRKDMRDKCGEYACFFCGRMGVSESLTHRDSLDPH